MSHEQAQHLQSGQGMIRHWCMLDGHVALLAFAFLNPAKQLALRNQCTASQSAVELRAIQISRDYWAVVKASLPAIFGVIDCARETQVSMNRLTTGSLD